MDTLGGAVPGGTLVAGDRRLRGADMKCQVVLSLFPGIGLLDRAFEQEGFCVVRGPDLLWGGDVHEFHPPAGTFDGVIAGPPCQKHSLLNRMNVKRGKGNAVDLIPEFSRCVEESQARWFLMENVPLAPDPHCPSYHVTASLLNNRQCPVDGSPVGPEQNRKRRFWFGVRRTESDKPVWLNVSKAVQENPVWSATVTANGISKPGTEHTRGKKERRLYGWSSWANLRRALQWQGFPEDLLRGTPLTLKGAFRMVGNGVPLPMGLAVARAVKDAIQGGVT